MTMWIVLQHLMVMPTDHLVVIDFVFAILTICMATCW